MADGLFWDLNTMKSTIVITYEDSFWESFSTCDGNSVPFLPLLPRRYLISGGSGAVLPLLSSTRNCQRSTFPDPFWMFHSQLQLMVDCFIHSSPCLLVGVLDAISMFWISLFDSGCWFFQHLLRYRQSILQITDLRTQNVFVFLMLREIIEIIFFKCRDRI